MCACRVCNDLGVFPSVASSLETDGNHLVPGDENMVDDAFIQVRIQVLQLVQHATGEQVDYRAKAGVHESTFLGAFL